MKQFRLFRSVVAGACMLAMGASSAWANFEQRDSSLGADTTVYDTLSGLTWMRLDLSYNVSYDFVKDNLVPGGVFHGFRVAETEELLGLFRNAEFVIDGAGDPGTYSPSREAANANFAAKFGGFDRGDGSTSFHGRYSSRFTPVQQAIASASYRPGQIGHAADSIFSDEGWVGRSSPDVGTWMVAAPVPEPGTYALMFGGLLAVGAWSRRRAQRAD